MGVEVYAWQGLRFFLAIRFRVRVRHPLKGGQYIHDSTECMSIDETSCKILTNQNFSDIDWRDFRIYVFVSAEQTGRLPKLANLAIIIEILLIH